MGLTDKQKDILLGNGWTEEDIAELPYEEASYAIGEILAKRQKSFMKHPYKKVVAQPQTDFVEKQGFRPEKKANEYKSSFDVSYSKDLTIALLQFQAELIKAGFIKDVKQLETAQEIGKKAVEIIKAIKAEFE